MQTQVRLAGWCSYPPSNTIEQFQKVAVSTNEQNSLATQDPSYAASQMQRSRWVGASQMHNRETDFKICYHRVQNLEALEHTNTTPA